MKEFAELTEWLMNMTLQQAAGNYRVNVRGE